MAQVGIVMGSDSDLSVMSKAAEVLDEFGISYEMHIISAHREPDLFFQWAKGAEDRGIKVIIAGAGMAAHLPGMCAALVPITGREGFPLFDRPDAVRNSCGDGRDRRRKKCRPSGCQDPCGIRQPSFGAFERIQRPHGCRSGEERCASSGCGIQELLM